LLVACFCTRFAPSVRSNPLSAPDNNRTSQPEKHPLGGCKSTVLRSLSPTAAKHTIHGFSYTTDLTTDTSTYVTYTFRLNMLSEITYWIHRMPRRTNTNYEAYTLLQSSITKNPRSTPSKEKADWKDPILKSDPTQWGTAIETGALELSTIWNNKDAIYALFTEYDADIKSLSFSIYATSPLSRYDLLTVLNLDTTFDEPDLQKKIPHEPSRKLLQSLVVIHTQDQRGHDIATASGVFLNKTSSSPHSTPSNGPTRQQSKHSRTTPPSRRSNTRLRHRP